MKSTMQTLDLGGVTLDLVLIEPGVFLMGSGNDLYSEDPVHEVRIERPFLLGRVPVTQCQWQSVMEDNPSHFPISAEHPVDSISWLAANRFCELASARIGQHVRLPTEAEWEFACRAGTRGEFFFTDAGPFIDDTCVLPVVRHELREFAWFDEVSNDSTHPVGRKRPNPWGLHDLIGNVWEWCADSWRSNYVGAPTDGSAWLTGTRDPEIRVLRGGAWDMNPFRCRSTYRSWDWQEKATSRHGLRVCVEV